MTAPLVWISGASSGIGQALAQEYARAGWRLALVARRAARVEDWARAQGLDAARCRVWAVDVRDVDALARAGAECIAGLGLPDVVIANAGVSVGIDTADRADLDIMRETLEVNLLGVAASFHPFLAPMRERRSGTLVAIASVAAIRGLPGHGAYCASKAGVVAYCESLRVECRAHGVRVLTLLPGFVATPLTARNRFAMPFLLSAPAFAQRARRAIAAGDAYRVIPWPMAIVARLLRALPITVYDRLIERRGRKRRRDE
jgi:short-subunit dehydrogenase